MRDGPFCCYIDFCLVFSLQERITCFRQWSSANYLVFISFSISILPMSPFLWILHLSTTALSAQHPGAAMMQCLMTATSVVHVPIKRRATLARPHDTPRVFLFAQHRQPTRPFAHCTHLTAFPFIRESSLPSHDASEQCIRISRPSYVLATASSCFRLGSLWAHTNLWHPNLACVGLRAMPQRSRHEGNLLQASPVSTRAPLLVTPPLTTARDLTSSSVSLDAR